MQNFRGLSNTCKLSPIDEPNRSTRLAGSQFARDLVNIHQSEVVAGMENVGKRTPSDPMETGCRDKTPSDAPRVSSRERRKLYAHGFKNNVYFMCSALVPPRGF